MGAQVMRKDPHIEDHAYDYVESVHTTFESDNSAFLRSIAISLARIADHLTVSEVENNLSVMADAFQSCDSKIDKFGNTLAAVIQAIKDK
jgi:hypothetical protein